jgi:hypothetical protein
MLKSSIDKIATLGLTLLFGTLTIASAATDVPVKKIVKVDQNAKAFTAHWTTKWVSKRSIAGHSDISHEVQYKTTDRTVYTFQGAKGSWANVQKGEKVKVTSHPQGSDHVADQVDITN